MRNLLRQTHRWIINYVICGSAVVIPFMAYASWQMIRHGQDVSTFKGLLGFLNDMAFVWILSLAYMILGLLFNKGFRESFVSRLAGFRECDEREALVTASASRNSFLLMLALEIVLLIMSVTTVHLYKDARGHGTITIGVGFSSQQLNIYAMPPHNQPANARWDIGGNLLPANMTIVFLLLILIQIGAFRVFSRRDYEALEI